MQINLKLFIGLCIGVLLLTILTYSNHFTNSFHFDDSHTIENNIYIRHIQNIPLFFKDGTTFSSLPSNQSYRPVVSTTLAIDYWLGNGLNTFYFHLSTFILFIIQGFLMLLLYLKIFNLSHKYKRNYILAIFAVAWYLLHPANAETINYIIARSDSISTLFVVLAFVLFIYSPFGRKWNLYLIPIAIGALAKPTAIMFAPLLLVYLILFENEIDFTHLFKKRNFNQILSAFKIALPSFLFCSFLYVFIQIMEPDTWEPGGTSVIDYLITQPFVIFHYFKTFLFPVWLSADNDWVVFSNFSDYRIYFGLLFIFIMLFIAFKTAQNQFTKPISFGILWFFIALVPTSSFIPLSEVMNDHRVFFPYVGLVFAICWSFALVVIQLKKSLISRQIINYVAVIAAIIMLAYYSYGTFLRNEVWKTDKSLWYDVTIKSPENIRGLMNYGLVLMASADYAGAENYFNTALELESNYLYLHINLGILKEAIKQPTEAEKFFKNAIAIGRTNPECYFYYAQFLYNQHRANEAIYNLNEAIEISKAHFKTRYLLMKIYYEQSQFERLAELANQTLQIIPNDQKSIIYLEHAKNRKTLLMLAIENAVKNRTPENLLELSLRYFETGQFYKCIEVAREALKFKPDYAEAYNNICAAYSELKIWDEAIIACEKALQIEPDFQLAKNNMKWARNQSQK